MSASNGWKRLNPVLRIHDFFAAFISPSLSPANLLLNSILVVSYYLAGRLSFELSRPDPSAIPVWLPAGITLAAMLLRGVAVWPSIFLGAFLMNVSVGVQVTASLGIAIGSTLETLFAYYLVNIFAGGKTAFFHPRHCVRFLLLAGALATALCALLGTWFVCNSGLVRWTEYWLVWRIWWLGDMLGVLLLTPFLVLLLGHKHHALSAREFVEIILLLSFISVVCVLNFGPPIVPWMPRSGLHYLCLPCLIWICFRFCPLEASGALLLLGGFAMWGSFHGYGLFANAAGWPFLGAVYVAAVGATTLGTAAAVVEMKQDLENALRAYYMLQGKQKEVAEEGTIRDPLYPSSASSALPPDCFPG